jgi:hypothetical protein
MTLRRENQFYLKCDASFCYEKFSFVSNEISKYLITLEGEQRAETIGWTHVLGLRRHLCTKHSEVKKITIEHVYSKYKNEIKTFYVCDEHTIFAIKSLRRGDYVFPFKKCNSCLVKGVLTLNELNVEFDRNDKVVNWEFA